MKFPGSRDRRGQGLFRSPAFSLVEMLVVIALIAILCALIVPASRVLEARRLDEAGRITFDEINLARQLAATRNLNVEIRFIQKKRNPADTATFHAVQRGLVGKDGSFTPVTKVTPLPDGIVFAPQAGLSSMIGSLPKNQSASFGYDYTSVVIRPTGMIEPQSGLALNAPWFVTAVYQRDGAVAEDKIANFVTIQIDPWTSRSIVYRP